MPKLKAPLFSLKATGRLGKFLTLAKRQGRHIIERRPIPTDAKSPAQLFSRLMFNKCIDLWHLLSDAERQEWESLARPRHMTGYAWYISQCLRPNPGIYLPLIGGTMTGDIDMGKNRLLKLPLPTDAQEAASKAYVDALAPGLHAATHEDGGADEIDVGGLAGLLAEDQHVIDAEVLAVAEAIGVAAGLIGVHAGVPAAHHARYIDAEAVTAMGAKADGNPLHHDRYADAEAQAVADARIVIHAAIAAAHHAKYTDAEAVTAAKTVKLDDFATPDDNADLNSSQTRHGLFKKLDGVATHFLNGLGNWVFAGGATLTVAETEVFNGNSPDPSAWTDLDLSGTVGANVALVMLKFHSSRSGKKIAVRKNGDTDDFYHISYAYLAGCARGGSTINGFHFVLLVATDGSGKIEWKSEGIARPTTIDIMAYIK